MHQAATTGHPKVIWGTHRSRNLQAAKEKEKATRISSARSCSELFIKHVIRVHFRDTCCVDLLRSLLAVEERGGLLEGQPLRLDNEKPEEHKLECYPADVHNLRVSDRDQETASCQ